MTEKPALHEVEPVAADAGMERAELIPMHAEAKARWGAAKIWGTISVFSGLIAFIGVHFIVSPVAFAFLAMVAFMSTIGACALALGHEMKTLKFEDGEMEVEHIAVRKARFGSKLHLLSTHAEYFVYPALDLNRKHLDAVLVRRGTDNRPVGWIVDGKGYDVVTQHGYLIRRISNAFCQLSMFFFYMICGVIFLALLAFAH